MWWYKSGLSYTISAEIKSYKLLIFLLIYKCFTQWVAFWTPLTCPQNKIYMGWNTIYDLGNDGICVL